MIDLFSLLTLFGGGVLNVILALFNLIASLFGGVAKTFLMVAFCLCLSTGCSGTFVLGGLGYDVKSVPEGIASANVVVKDTTVEWFFDPWTGIEKLVKGVTGLIVPFVPSG